MGAALFSHGQLRRLTREFKRQFGKTHALCVTYEPKSTSTVTTAVLMGMATTTINARDAPTTRAVFRYGRAVAAHEYALRHETMRLKTHPMKSMRFLADSGAVDAVDATRDAITGYVSTAIYHTSALTRNKNAADYVAYERIKYARLHTQNPNNLRGLPILAKAYVGVAAEQYGVDVDLEELTFGIRIDDADRAIHDAAADMLRSLNLQRARGDDVDLRPHAKKLDGALSRQHRLFTVD